MARIIGGVGTTHVPSIGNAIAKGLQQDPYWKPFFDGFSAVHRWLRRYAARCRRGVLQRPRAELLSRQDADIRDRCGGANIATPTRAGACRCRGRSRAMRRFPGTSSNRWSPTNSTSRLARRCWSITPSRSRWRCCGRGRQTGRCAPSRSPSTPSSIRCHRRRGATNSARRSVARSTATSRMCACWWSAPAGCRTNSTASAPASSTRTSTCGVSINSSGIPRALTRYSTLKIIQEAGTQGVELLNWIAMRGALTGRVGKLHSNYHVPISNTASAVLLLENEAQAEMRKAG